MTHVGLFNRIKNARSNIGVLSAVTDEQMKIIEWKIPDFLSLQNCKRRWTPSPTFDFANESWYLRIYPGGNEESSEGYIAVLLCRRSRNRVQKEPPITANYVLSIKRTDGLEAVTSGLCNFEEEEEWGEFDFLHRSELEQRKSELLPDDALTIVCELKLEYNRSPLADASSMELVELEKLSENFKELLASEETCDTTLKVQDREFQTHKAVLIARSSVFAAMFRHEMSEKQTGVIPITDCDPASFQEFLHYLYTGTIKNVTSSSAYHLYITADKYDVRELKAFCSEYMQRSVTVGNVCDVAVLADEDKLFAAVQAFFTDNLDKILQTKNWKSLITSNVHLAQKLLMGMAADFAVLKKSTKKISQKSK